jgi:hypothetical protein
MRLSKLRIAWSVAWGLLAVLLCVLWVRSYYHVDALHVPLVGNHALIVASCRGQMTWTATPDIPLAWQTATIAAGDDWYRAPWGLSYPSGANLFELALPHWFSATVCGVISVLPWLPRRFSLRTLLIATTLVAVVLGLAVWANC